MCGYCDDTGFVEELCPDCNGSGEGLYDGSVCRECRGSGVKHVECECDDDYIEVE